MSVPPVNAPSHESDPEYEPLGEFPVIPDIVPLSVAVHEGVGSLAGSAGNVAVHVTVVPDVVPESVPVLLRWQELQNSCPVAGSVDCVVTVPETFAPVCVSFQVTIVVIIGMVLAVFDSFESTPVPVRITFASGSGTGCGCCPGLCWTCCSGMPEPAPQAAASAAKAVAVMIVRTGLMTPRSPPRAVRSYGKQRASPFHPAFGALRARSANSMTTAPTARTPSPTRACLPWYSKLL